MILEIKEDFDAENKFYNKFYLKNIYGFLNGYLNKRNIEYSSKERFDIQVYYPKKMIANESNTIKIKLTYYLVNDFSYFQPRYFYTNPSIVNVSIYADPNNFDGNRYYLELNDLKRITSCVMSRLQYEYDRFNITEEIRDFIIQNYEGCDNGERFFRRSIELMNHKEKAYKKASDDSFKIFKKISKAEKKYKIR